MYLVDFIKRMTRKSNIPVLIYLVLNIFVIAGIVSFLFGGGTMPFWQALLIGIVLYAISLVIALSPIGECILRLQTGCKKIKRVEQINFIEPIFREVYDKAKKLDPSIPDDVQLYMNTDEDPNAFATGRKTICVTEGMLHMPESQIKATLGHEFGHLAHKDTDLILVVSVGNLIVSAFILGIRLVIDLFHLVFGLCTIFMGGSEGAVAAILNAIYHAMITAIVAGLTWVWTKIGVLLVMKASRANEYEADDLAGSLAARFENIPDLNVTLMTKDFDYVQLLNQSKNTTVWMIQSGKGGNLLPAMENADCPDNVDELDEKSACERYGIPNAKTVIDFKALAGDKSDNIPGVKGVGDESAKKLISKYFTIESLYKDIQINGPDIENKWKEVLGLRKGYYKKLVTEKDNAFLSKKLATIKTDIQLGYQLEDFICPTDWEKFDQQFKKYEMSSLRAELAKMQ